MEEGWRGRGLQFLLVTLKKRKVERQLGVEVLGGNKQVKSWRADGGRGRERGRETARGGKKGNLVRNGGCGLLISGSLPQLRLTEWGRPCLGVPINSHTYTAPPLPTRPASEGRKKKWVGREEPERGKKLGT